VARHRKMEWRCDGRQIKWSSLIKFYDNCRLRRKAAGSSSKIPDK